MKLDAIGSLADLKRIFLTPRLPKPQPGHNAVIAPAFTTRDKDGNLVVREPLVERAVTCAGCGKATGTLRRATETTYLHKGCTPR